MTSLKNDKDTFSYYMKSFKCNFERPLENIWGDYDKDKTGQLDKEQSRQFVQQVSLVIQRDKAYNYDKSKFDQMFMIFDEDKNGMLSKAEMCQFIKIAFKKDK